MTTAMDEEVLHLRAAIHALEAAKHCLSYTGNGIPFVLHELTDKYDQRIAEIVRKHPWIDRNGD